jgi:multiple sugar transport system ATP-binding protein
MAELTVQSLSKSFGATRAVDGLDFTLPDGRCLVLLGPSGAGKTTTLRLIAGLETPEHGKVHLGGREVTQVHPADRDVSFVFQQYSLYPHLTVYDNIAFPLRAPRRRMPEQDIRRRVGEVAELVRISAKLGNSATRLSGGEMQRVAIARALVREPAVFLMDEPLSSLDAKLRHELRIELKRIQLERGATIVYVTHDQTEATTLGDLIGVLDHGRLVQLDTPSGLYTQPDSVYAARVLGSPTLNLLPVDALWPERGGTARLAGVRPEDLTLSETGPWRARVEVVERLGAETIAVLDMDGYALRALLPGGAPTPAAGAHVHLSVEPQRILYFDEQERRVRA